MFFGFCTYCINYRLCVRNCITVMSINLRYGFSYLQCISRSFFLSVSGSLFCPPVLFSFRSSAIALLLRSSVVFLSDRLSFFLLFCRSFSLSVRSLCPSVGHCFFPSVGRFLLPSSVVLFLVVFSFFSKKTIYCCRTRRLSVCPSAVCRMWKKFFSR